MVIFASHLDTWWTINLRKPVLVTDIEQNFGIQKQSIVNCRPRKILPRKKMTFYQTANTVHKESNFAITLQWISVSFYKCEIQSSTIQQCSQVHTKGISLPSARKCSLKFLEKSCIFNFIPQNDYFPMVHGRATSSEDIYIISMLYVSQRNMYKG